MNWNSSDACSPPMATPLTFSMQLGRKTSQPVCWKYSLPHCHEMSFIITIHTAADIDQLNSYLSIAYPQIKFAFIVKNNSTIGFFFRFKGSLPMCTPSNFIYKYLCKSCHAFLLVVHGSIWKLGLIDILDFHQLPAKQ